VKSAGSAGCGVGLLLGPVAQHWLRSRPLVSIRLALHALFDIEFKTTSLSLPFLFGLYFLSLAEIRQMEVDGFGSEKKLLLHKWIYSSFMDEHSCHLILTDVMPVVGTFPLS